MDRLLCAPGTLGVLATAAMMRAAQLILVVWSCSGWLIRGLPGFCCLLARRRCCRDNSELVFTVRGRNLMSLPTGYRIADMVVCLDYPAAECGQLAALARCVG
jgi:hypothetical protein